VLSHRILSDDRRPDELRNPSKRYSEAPKPSSVEDSPDGWGKPGAPRDDLTVKP